MLRKLLRFRRLAFCLLLFYMVVVICNSPHDFVITKKSADEFLWAFVKPVYKTISQTVWLFSEDGRERLNISIIQNVDSHMILYPPKSDLTTAVINPAVNPAVNLAANPSVNQATSPTISTSVTPTVNQVVNPTVPLKPHNISTTFRPSTVPAIKKKNATDTKNETKVKYVGEPFERFLVNLSDNNYYNPYIKPVMYTKASCLKASTYDAIIAVHSAPGNDQKRQMLRWLYADPSQTRPYRIKVFFFIGLVNDSLTQSKLLQEGQKFGDIVQGSFIDSYRNLTFKAVFVYSWLSEHCKGLKLLLRLDDDVFVDVHFFFKVWKSRVGNKPSTIMCDFVFNDLVRRHGKWFTSVAEIPETHYNFRHCMGYFAALTYDLVPKMAEVGRRTLFFWIDDVFVYGFLAKKLGADFVNVYRETSRGKSGRFEDCLKTQGPKCKLMVFVTHNIEKFPQFFSLTHNNTHLEQNIDKKKEGKSRPSKA